MITVILTGGKSRRMGRDKAALPLDGKPMALRLAERFAALGDVAFSVNKAGRFDAAGFAEFVDRYPDQGPLNGLVSALYDSGEEYVLLLATDMPAVTTEAAKMLTEAIGEHDACVYADEPLFGLYCRRCLPVAEECLKEGKNAMRGFLERIDVLSIPLANKELALNLNTPEEYEDYQKRTV